MFSKKTLKDNLTQIIALTEKNIKLELRYKFSLLITYISHILSIFIPLILMGNIFELRSIVGPWTTNNFLLYQFLAYEVVLLYGITNTFPLQFRMEKYWKTYPALIVGPISQFNLLFGIFLSQLILLSLPFIIFFIIEILIFPISLLTAIFILIIFLLLALIFSGIGLIFGIFAISNENIWNFLRYSLLFIFWFSCVTYPFEIFPEFIQSFIIINPLYYIFDLLRLTWIQNIGFGIIISYPLHFTFLLLTSILLPIIGVYLYNLVYKKYGITGY